MASITLPARSDTQAHPNIRPLSVLRDLPPVADLIESCFSSTMDGDGKRYVQDMRRAGSDNSFLQWAKRAADSTSLPLTGYVWEEDRRIVGNVSLVPFRRDKHRLYLIANVAVHPEYRRRGIARALTLRAMQHARERKIHDIWLNVRADNPEAVHLYESLGFLERARRTTWQAVTDSRVEGNRTDIAVTNRHPRFWIQQLEWLSRLYPSDLAWHSKWNFSLLKPGFLNWLYLFFIDINVRQWAAVRGESLLATLAWIPTGRGESLFAAAGERSDPEALTVLLQQARHDLYRYYSNVSLEFPVSRFDDAIQAAGFKPQRTLIWMQAPTP
ncbi:MAG: GNAT family N-acetyltransferase [Anaerolineales bacterium]|nr:GNAT family N-acetyltransferase [Anaerolineales bacterium]